jgi:hypothetical protein
MYSVLAFICVYYTCTVVKLNNLCKIKDSGKKIEERRAWKAKFITCEHLFGKNYCCLSLVNVSFSDSLEDFMIAGRNNDAFSLFFKGMSLYRISALSSAHACNPLPYRQV